MEIEMNQLPSVLRVTVNKSLMEKNKKHLAHFFTENKMVMGRPHPNLVTALFPRERFSEAFDLYSEVRDSCAGSRNWLL